MPNVITIKELQQIQGLKELKICAGHQGNSNVIRWPYIAESSDIEPWIKGGELIFVTGLNWNWVTDDFIELIKKAQKCSASGLVILTNSPYIRSIPLDVINYANDVCFPVLEQPYSLPLVNITELISNAIIMDDLKNKSAKWFIQHLASSLYVTDLDLNKASELGINPNQALSIAFINLVDVESSSIITCQYLIEQFAREHKSPLPITEYHHGWLAVIPRIEQSESKTLEFWQLLQDRLLENEYPSKIGVSDANTLERFSVSASQAMQSSAFGGGGNLIHYNSLGIAQIFTKIENKNDLKYFCQQQLGNAFNSEDKQIKVLKLTLHCYFENLCSLRKTANELKIHRNTLTNRLEKFESLVGQDLNNAQQRLNIQTALLAERFLIK
uniref:PucR family transcriptional regulator n=2 Tax=Gammaproteobacteria TaxID=1236 RepID=UPI0036D40B04